MLLYSFFFRASVAIRIVVGLWRCARRVRVVKNIYARMIRRLDGGVAVREDIISLI